MILQYKGFILKLDCKPFNMAGKEIEIICTKENIKEVCNLIDLL